MELRERVYGRKGMLATGGVGAVMEMEAVSGTGACVLGGEGGNDVLMCLGRG